MFSIPGKVLQEQQRMQKTQAQQKEGKELKEKNITLFLDYLKSSQIRETISQVDENKIPGEE